MAYAWAGGPLDVASAGTGGPGRPLQATRSRARRQPAALQGPWSRRGPARASRRRGPMLRIDRALFVASHGFLNAFPGRTAQDGGREGP
jgi:hypothetical protein